MWLLEHWTYLTWLDIQLPAAQLPSYSGQNNVSSSLYSTGNCCGPDLSSWSHLSGYSCINTELLTVTPPAVIIGNISLTSNSPTVPSSSVPDRGWKRYNEKIVRCRIIADSESWRNCLCVLSVVSVLKWCRVISGLCLYISSKQRSWQPVTPQSHHRQHLPQCSAEIWSALSFLC